MSTPRTAAPAAPRGATPEGLAALLVVLTAMRRAPDRPGPPATGRGWDPRAAWNRPAPAVAPLAAGWQRTTTSRHGRNA